MPKDFEYPISPSNRNAVTAIYRALGRLSDAVPDLRSAADEAVEAVMAARQRQDARKAARAALQRERVHSRDIGLG